MSAERANPTHGKKEKKNAGKANPTKDLTQIQERDDEERKSQEEKFNLQYYDVDKQFDYHPPNTNYYVLPEENDEFDPNKNPNLNFFAAPDDLKKEKVLFELQEEDDDQDRLSISTKTQSTRQTDKHTFLTKTVNF